MHIVLAGQPQLAEKLASPGLIQLRQRISIISHLKPFTEEETQRYIDHRLRVADYDFTRPLFTKQAKEMIARYTAGFPATSTTFALTLCLSAVLLNKEPSTQR